MTTQEYLGQVEKYNRMIKNKLEDVGKLRAMATSITLSPKDVDVQKTTDKDKIGSVVVKIIDMEKDVDVLIDKRCRIINQIESVSDQNMYEVLAQRYIKNIQPKSICIAKIGSERHVRRILRAAETEFERMYGAEYM